MPKAKKLDGRAVYELFIGLSQREQAEFFGWCLSRSGPENLIGKLVATGVEADKSFVRYYKKKEKFNHKDKKPTARRKAYVKQLKEDRGLSVEEIHDGHQVELSALQPGKKKGKPVSLATLYKDYYAD